MLTNVIICAVVALIVGNAVYRIYKAKKNGQGCIGCPDSKNCGKCNCGCSGDDS